MDENPQDHFQMTCPMIKLKSSDGEVFEVEVKVSKLSLTIKEMLDELGMMEEMETISIPKNAPEISGTILGKIIQWANHHKDDPAAAEDDENKVKPTDEISSWDVEFLKADQTTLFQLIRAADYLNIKGLLDVTCKTVAEIMKGIALGDIRLRFNIQNDFSPDEQKQNSCDLVWFRPIDPNNETSVNFNNVGAEIPADFFQNMDHEDDQVVVDCFRNPNIVRKVLEHFSNHELLNELQFVSKLWNCESRIVMKKRGNVIAQLMLRDDRAHQELEAFALHLRQMNIVPYSGLFIEIKFSGQTLVSSGLDSTHETVLNRLPIKHLSVRLTSDWWTYKNSNSTLLLLLKKILQDLSDDMHELTVDIQEDGGGQVEFINLVRGYKFNRLKVLKLQKSTRGPGEISTNSWYITALVACSPTLRELHADGPFNLRLHGRKEVLIHHYEVCAPFDDIPLRAVNTLRLKRIQMKYTSPLFSLARINRITPMLLRASNTTLSSMEIDVVFAIPLMCYGISLENVKQLRIHVNYNQLELVRPQIWRIVKNFDFSRLFPNVRKVEIWHTGQDWELSAVHLITMIAQARMYLREPAARDRAANVKELNILYWYPCNIAAALFYAELLPSIEKLTVDAIAEQENLFGFIWKHWRNLTDLEVRGKICASNQNLDSVFCGIFPEEVAELRQKDEVYLKTVNIVPVMPAITCLKDLKALTVNYEHPDFEPFVVDGTFIFSKVTALIAFARCPTLAVSLTITSYAAPPAMTHLEPHVSVKSSLLRVYDDDEWDD